MRTATSKPSSSRCTIWSLKKVRDRSCGCCAMKSSSTGATCRRPNITGAVIDNTPCGTLWARLADASASSISARMRLQSARKARAGLGERHAARAAAQELRAHTRFSAAMARVTAGGDRPSPGRRRKTACSATATKMRMPSSLSIVSFLCAKLSSARRGDSAALWRWLRFTHRNLHPQRHAHDPPLPAPALRPRPSCAAVPVAARPAVRDGSRSTCSRANRRRPSTWR